MLVELGNNHPQDTTSVVDPDTGEATLIRKDGKYPSVARIFIPEGRAGRLFGLEQRPGEDYEEFERRDAEHAEETQGDLLYTIPDEFSDDDFAGHPATEHIAEALAGVTEESKSAVRRAMIGGQLSNPNVPGLPNHEAFVAIADPNNGFWSAVARPGSRPAWVSVPNHPGLEQMLADYFDCPRGAPDNVEDLYLTVHGGGIYPPGAAPDPLSDFKALHTTIGRVNQANVMGGFGYLGTVGTATAATATTLTGSAETGVTHVANDCAGQYLVVGPNAAGTGSKVFGLILSNTSGTTPVYTVDRWYDTATPGGAAGTTPNATAFYQVVNGGPPAVFVALSTDTTAKSLGGTAGTADAPTLAQVLTGEFSTASSGLLRKIAAIGQSGATYTVTVTFTATATDQGLGAQTVGTAASSPSLVRTAGALTYMTLVSPTATLTATGDQLTLTWTFTMT
jgi:hypothetical protein